MLSQVVAAVELVAVCVLFTTYSFPLGVLFALFRMDDTQIRHMEHYLDFPSVAFSDEPATKDYLTVLGANASAAVILSVAEGTPFFLLSVVALAVAMFAPMQSFAQRKLRLQRSTL